MSENKVIIFGPTGNIGSVTAITAREHGAQVFLAMRDTSKTIPGLSPEQEKAGSFERVSADLTKPETVSRAVKDSGAKRAYFYIAIGTDDHLRSSIKAMKSAGIDFAVFLSTASVRGTPADITRKDIIPFIHAQIELNLEEIFGQKNYVAVRPGSFATNTLQWKAQIPTGKLRLQRPDHLNDLITPEDMGRVSGSILAKGEQPNGKPFVYLFGPKLTSQYEAVAIIAKTLRKNIEIVPLTKQQAIDEGARPPFSAYVAESIDKAPSDGMYFATKEEHEAIVGNIEKFGGRSSTGFPQWMEANKQLFA